MELILLAAIAYAAARGVESIVGDTKKRYGSKVADAVVKKAAKNKKEDPKDGADPTAPGGTFSAREAAPRTASLGTKTAAALATGLEVGATFRKSYLEGYREAWPTAREEARKRQVERAKQRQAARDAKHERRRAEGEAAEAQRQADAAADAAEAARVAAEEAAAAPAPVSPPIPPDVPEPAAEKPAATEPDDAPVKSNLILLKPTAPALTPTGDTVIPEVRTLDGLLNALLITKGNCLMRAEEAEAIAVRDVELAGQLDAFEAGLADLEVDPETLAEIASLREKIAAQAAAASTYGIAAQNAADLASATANAAHMAHGGIAEAVQSAPIEAAAQAGYYNR